MVVETTEERTKFIRREMDDLRRPEVLLLKFLRAHTHTHEDVRTTTRSELVRIASYADCARETTVPDI